MILDAMTGLRNQIAKGGGESVPFMSLVGKCITQDSNVNARDKMVEAAQPLYASLDAGQKHKFITLGRMLVPERGRFAKEMRRLSAGKGAQQSAK
jgi:hypothetical protein